MQVYEVWVSRRENRTTLLAKPEPRVIPALARRAASGLPRIPDPTNPLDGKRTHFKAFSVFVGAPFMLSDWGHGEGWALREETGALQWRPCACCPITQSASEFTQLGIPNPAAIEPSHLLGLEQNCAGVSWLILDLQHCHSRA